MVVYSSFMESWQKQSKDTPLYPELEWEKPERKDQAGTLMIIGGNLHGFSSVALADKVAREHGIGSTRVLLPDALRKTLAPLWTDAIFCPSTSTGSFSKDSGDIILQNALSTHGIIISGDLGRNSETAVVLDMLLRSYKGPVAVTRDSLDYYLERPKELVQRDSTLIVGSFSQMQKLLSVSGSSDPLVYTMPLASLVGTLSRFTATLPCMLVTRSDNQIIVAYKGQVTTSRLEEAGEIWRLETATKAIVSWIHHTARPLEAVTYSVFS